MTDDQPRTALQATFEAVYRAEFARIVLLVQFSVGRRDVAEEIAQDAFVIAHDRWSRIGSYDRPADFVRRVALNRAFSNYRRRQAEHRALDRAESRAATVKPLTVHDEADVDDWLWLEIRKLPARQAQAIALTYVDDLPVPRVAEVLGCSENTVKTHLRRGREALARSIADRRPTADGGVDDLEERTHD